MSSIIRAKMARKTPMVAGPAQAAVIAAEIDSPEELVR